MPQNTASFTFEDYDAEKATMSVNIGPLTAANTVAKHAAIESLETALGGLTLGEIRRTNITETFNGSTAQVTEQVAQRESKWLVTYRDVTEFFDVGNTINNVGFGNIYTVEIPTADVSLLANNSDALVLADGGPVAAFVTAFEAVQNSPTGGNEIEVISIRHVGRAS